MFVVVLLAKHTKDTIFPQVFFNSRVFQAASQSFSKMSFFFSFYFLIYQHIIYKVVGLYFCFYIYTHIVRNVKSHSRETINDEIYKFQVLRYAFLLQIEIMSSFRWNISGMFTLKTLLCIRYENGMFCIVLWFVP